MTDRFSRAEELLDLARGLLPGSAGANLIQAAQVHATLAVAEATAADCRTCGDVP